VSRWSARIVIVLLAVYGCALLLASPFAAALLGSPSGPVPLGDFGSFYASGEAARQGLDPFGVYPLTLDANLGQGSGAAANLSAPFSVVLFQFMSAFDPQSARLGWFVASLAAFGLSVGLLARSNWRIRSLHIVWPFAMAGFWETLAEPRLPAGVQKVIVTEGGEQERPARLRKLAPKCVPVIMSSSAWQDYAVPGARKFPAEFTSTAAKLENTLISANESERVVMGGIEATLDGVRNEILFELRVGAYRSGGCRIPIYSPHNGPRVFEPVNVADLVTIKRRDGHFDDKEVLMMQLDNDFRVEVEIVG